MGCCFRPVGVADQHCSQHLQQVHMQPNFRTPHCSLSTPSLWLQRGHARQPNAVWSGELRPVLPASHQLLKSKILTSISIAYKFKCLYGSKFSKVKKQMIKWHTILATHTIDKKIISLFYRELMQINKNEYEQANCKMGKGYEKQFTEKQVQRANNVWKDVQLFSNWRHVNLNHKMPFSPIRLAKI